MKAAKNVFALINVFFFTMIFAQESVPSEKKTEQTIEENKIRHIVEAQYIKALQIRDFELIRTVCIPQAKLMGVNREGQLNITTLDMWSKRFDPQNPPFKKLEYEILKIDMEGTAAQVKIRFLVNSKNFITDYLHMLKLEGKWRIVNIIDF